MRPTHICPPLVFAITAFGIDLIVKITVPAVTGLCVKFLPGNHHLILGTRAGTIDLYALGPGTKIQSYDAHEGAVWALAIRPDKRG